MTADAEFAALFKFVERAAPDDPQPLLVLADWCQDHDRDPWCFALRWCAGRKVRPFFRTDVRRQPWEWLRVQTNYRNLTRNQVAARRHAALHPSVFDLMGVTRDAATIAFVSTRAAYEALARALGTIRSLLDVPDLPATIAPPTGVDLVCCRSCGISRGKWFEVCPVCKATEVL